MNDDNDLDDDSPWYYIDDTKSFFGVSVAVVVFVVICGLCGCGNGDDSDNPNEDWRCSYVVASLWIAFHLFDIMSDWGFYAFDCPDTLKTPSLVFCIFGTILTVISILFNIGIARDSRSYWPGLGNRPDDSILKLMRGNGPLGMGLFLLEDLPQAVIVVHAIMTPSLYADDQYDNDDDGDQPQEPFQDKALGTKGIISLVFSSLGLLFGFVKTAMWCCRAHAQESE